MWLSSLMYDLISRQLQNGVSERTIAMAATESANDGMEESFQNCCYVKKLFIIILLIKAFKPDAFV